MATAALTIPRGEQMSSGIVWDPINTPQWPHGVCVGLAWLDRRGKKPSVKGDLLIYSICVTVSGQCMSVAIIISSKMDFNSCVVFPNPVTYMICI